MRHRSPPPIRPGTSGQEMAAGQIPNYVYQLAYQMALEEIFSHKLIRFNNKKPVHIQGFCCNAKRTDPASFEHEFCGHCTTSYKKHVRIQIGNRGTVQTPSDASRI